MIKPIVPESSNLTYIEDAMALSSVFVTWKNFRWYHWLFAGLVFVYVIYIAVSYFYLPGKLKQVVQKDTAELIGHPIHVEQIAFNPFSLSLTVNDFAIDDNPDRRLVAWQELFVNFSFWRSLFKWEIALEALFLKNSHINIEKHAEGFNFSDILERFASEEKDPPSEKSGIALEIQEIAIEEGGSLAAKNRRLPNWITLTFTLKIFTLPPAMKNSIRLMWRPVCPAGGHCI